MKKNLPTNIEMDDIRYFVGKIERMNKDPSLEKTITELKVLVNILNNEKEKSKTHI